MILRIFLNVLLVLGLLVGLAGVKFLQVQAMIQAGESFVPPPVAVGVAEARAESWEALLTSVGTVEAVEGVTVRAEVAGVVTRIAYEPGGRAEAGDVLVELDRSIEEANLEQAQAELDIADTRLRRARRLFESDTVPEADLDDAVAAHAAARSRVASLRATLDKKTIRAPFSGQLGVKLISKGQYLDPGDAIVELQALDRVFVDFSLPQQELERLAAGLPVRVATNAHPDRVFDGRISAIDPRIDPATRNVPVQAVFDNPGGRLRSGMFVSVEVVLPTRDDVVAIPATSVLYAPFGDSVFVVAESAADDGSTSLVATQRIVRLGRTRGDFVEVLEGVAAGERVVSAGAFKLRTGQTITVSDVGVKPPLEEPTPDDA